MLDFDMAMFMEYISPIVMLFCLVVGWVIKGFANDKVSKFIPIFVMLLGILCNLWYTDWTFAFPVVVTGAVSGLASTGLYEAIDNMFKLFSNKTTVTLAANETCEIVEKSPDDIEVEAEG